MKWLFVPWIHRISQEDVCCEEFGEKGILSLCKRAAPLTQVISVLPLLSKTFTKTIILTLQSENANSACGKLSCSRTRMPGSWHTTPESVFSSTLLQTRPDPRVSSPTPAEFSGKIPMYWLGWDLWNQNLSVTTQFPPNLRSAHLHQGLFNGLRWRTAICAQQIARSTCLPND